MPRVWHKPKSTCKCGHLGDGPNSEHSDDRFEAGHGACKVSTCGCLQFSWNGFLPEFIRYMNISLEGDTNG